MQKHAEHAGTSPPSAGPVDPAESGAAVPADPAGREHANQVATSVKSIAPEIGGRVGPEPTRFGDWEKNGRCIDF
ncbi:MAG: DUF1674 domain-containing protein [Xanthomonadales bacterium]|nr:DUF1674 domain-containing protein [Xanthomonadales bacterium]